MSESNTVKERLYHLLPAIYRARDVQQGEPLRVLLAVIESELRVLEADIDALYDNWFIETCDEWVVPYLGDLLGIRGLSAKESTIFSLRAMVANTMAYRRRKGTVRALEEMVRDVTGWYALVIEFRDFLAATQHLDHLCPGKGGLLDLRDTDGLEALGSLFESAAHTIDVRRIASNRGKYNILNVGLLVWRLQSYAVTQSPAHAIADPADGRYTFHPLGYNAPLFNQPQAETETSHAAERFNLPGPISPQAFASDLAEYRASAPEHRLPESAYYGPNRSLNVIRDGEPVPPANVVSQDLRDWVRPPTGQVAVDVRLGRLAFAEGEKPAQVEVSYTYGFSADIGGGPYDRYQTLADSQSATWQVAVAKGSAVATLKQALDDWNTHCDDQKEPRGIIRIMDNGIYGGNVDVDLPDGGWLVIEAADGVRPSLRLVGNMDVSATGAAVLTLNGLLIEGRIEVAGELTLNVAHCTLVPGRMLDERGEPAFPDWDVLVADVGGSGLVVDVTSSIVGPLRLPKCRHLAIRDSIVDASSVRGEPRPAIAADDAGKYGPPTILERTTVLGSVYVKELELASEVIFTAPVMVERRQIGCVRYSFVPKGSRPPRRFRCQPDLALGEGEEEDLAVGRLRPVFTSIRYGHAGYGQLSPDCPQEIHTGAEDGSEMGAFSHLRQPQREANLRAILDEYLRARLEAGIFYVA